MAPGVWDVDDLVEGGLASIEEFTGRLVDVEEDVEGKFGLQKEFHFEDVEIIKAADDVSLEEGRYTCWVGQNNKKNSTHGKMLADWTEFAKLHKLGPLPDCFYGTLLRWEKTTYEFGEEMSPGRAMIPVELVEEGGSEKKSKSKASTKSKSKTTVKAPPVDPEDSDDDSGIPAEIRELVLNTVGEDGATKDMIRRVITKTSVNRKIIAGIGGIDSVLEGLEDALDEDDGTYTRVEL